MPARPHQSKTAKNCPELDKELDKQTPGERRPAQIQVRYGSADRYPPAGPDLLAVVHFGSTGAQAGAAPLNINVHLAPIDAATHAECWLANGPVRQGRCGRVRYAHDDHFLFGVVEDDEQAHGGIRGTAATVYNEILRFQRGSSFPHFLRLWNYLDAINEGAGDRERYREFCVGRAQGLTGALTEHFPAATAIGRQQSTGQLQVFWLAGRNQGAAIENPRQLSAYHYPRAHGPASPSFSRATRAPDDAGTVLISGTASIVGHRSQHPGDPLEQLEETLRNLAALTSRADLPGGAAFPTSLLKVYVRDACYADAIKQRLTAVWPGGEAIFLAADICRRELLIEIEAIEKHHSG